MYVFTRIRMNVIKVDRIEIVFAIPRFSGVLIYISYIFNNNFIIT